MRRNYTSDERGFAMIAALFMVLILSVLASSLMFVSRTETLSSLNYKTMTQVRYGAEAGVHDALNHLLWTYSAPGTALDPLASYNVTTSPVQYNGAPVVLSSDAAFASNYPVASVRDAFIAASAGGLAISVGSISYTSRATLLSMQQFVDSASGLPAVLQRWQVTGRGQVAGAGSAEVEVSAIVERPQVALYRYAAFATADTCGALSFSGGATVNSYDSRNALVSGVPVIGDYGGNVGTNGNTSTNGSKTDIHGTLSTPRTGVGGCSSGNVSALSGNDTSVDGGLVQLPQVVTFPTPPAIVPAPPTTNMSFGSCPVGGVLYCTSVAGGARYSPPSPSSVVQLGNVNVGNGDTLRLNAGIYEINSIEVKGDLIVESGPVIIRIAGAGTSTPINMTAGSISNTSYAAQNLQFIYGGTGEVKLRGNAAFAAVIYAPNAETDFAGNGDFYGAVLTRTVRATGGSSIHYDRALDAGGFTVGNPVMSAFTWKSF